MSVWAITDSASASDGAVQMKVNRWAYHYDQIPISGVVLRADGFPLKLRQAPFTVDRPVCGPVLHPADPLMGVFFIQKMSPTTNDPFGKKIMAFVVIFTVLPVVPVRSGAVYRQQHKQRYSAAADTAVWAAGL